ncbi:MAG: aldose 1-epimerase [Acidimicrobiia bacterium]|nr:aldose 1-epimerase [Acidimicrobiia bacterium]
MTGTVTREAGRARLEIDLAAGGRLASLQVHGHELLVTSGPGPIHWGAYPMAPYAGRVRNGRFTFRGRAYELPVTLGGHAIHGTAYVQSWEEQSDGAFVTSLGPGWPFPGWARQEIRLAHDGVSLRLEVHCEEGAMPASCGWHPWFVRRIGGAVAILDFHPGFMLERDGAGISTRERRSPSAGPWDDCFGDVQGSPAISWPGLLRLELQSACPYWVVFDRREHAFCVEPQTAPPDALNHDPFVVEPGRPLVAEFAIKWSLPPRADG